MLFFVGFAIKQLSHVDHHSNEVGEEHDTKEPPAVGLVVGLIVLVALLVLLHLIIDPKLKDCLLNKQQRSISRAAKFNKSYGAPLQIFALKPIARTISSTKSLVVDEV